MKYYIYFICLYKPVLYYYYICAHIYIYNIILYSSDTGLSLLGGIFFKNKRYIHLGRLAPQAIINKVALLASNNEVFFVYNTEVLVALASAAAEVEGIQTISWYNLKSHSKKNYVLNIVVNNKSIFIKNIQLFLNISISTIYKLQHKQWFEAPKVSDAAQLLIYYKEDSRVFSAFLKNLNFFLNQLSSS